MRLQRIAAYAYVVQAGSLLLTRISDLGHHAGFWTLPGGGVDHGEPPRTALVREFAEETGLTAVPGRLLDVHDTHFTGRAPNGELEDYHGVHLIFAAEIAGDQPAQVVEVDGTTDAVAWVPLADIEAQRLPVLDLVSFSVGSAWGRAGSVSSE